MNLTLCGLYKIKCELSWKYSKGASTLLMLVLVLARLVLVGRLVWLLLVLINLRPHYFSCSPGFGAWGSVYLLVVCIGCSTSASNVDGPLKEEASMYEESTGRINWIKYCGVFAPYKNCWAIETTVTKYYTYSTIEQRGYATRFQASAR
jgi:hypothetical protein